MAVRRTTSSLLYLFVGSLPVFCGLLLCSLPQQMSHANVIVSVCYLFCVGLLLPLEILDGFLALLFVLLVENKKMRKREILCSYSLRVPFSFVRLLQRLSSSSLLLRRRPSSSSLRLPAQKVSDEISLTDLLCSFLTFFFFSASSAAFFFFASSSAFFFASASAAAFCRCSSSARFFFSASSASNFYKRMSNDDKDDIPPLT